MVSIPLKILEILVILHLHLVLCPWSMKVPDGLRVAVIGVEEPWELKGAGGYLDRLNGREKGERFFNAISNLYIAPISLPKSSL